jgi:hypothetical protein
MPDPVKQKVIALYPTEPKVKAATVGAAVGGAVDWALATYAFHGVVPPQVALLVQVVVPILLAFVGGWLGRHQDRAPATVVPGAPVVLATPVLPADSPAAPVA